MKFYYIKVAGQGQRKTPAMTLSGLLGLLEGKIAVSSNHPGTTGVFL